MTIPIELATISKTPRKVNKSASSNDSHHRQEFATSGKDLPEGTAAPVSESYGGGYELEEVLEHITSYASRVNRELDFTVDEDFNGTMVWVQDRETGEVIRQIPSEELLRLAKHFTDFKMVEDSQLLKGILLQKDA